MHGLDRGIVVVEAGDFGFVALASGLWAVNEGSFGGMIALDDLAIFIELGDDGGDENDQVFYFVRVDTDDPAPIVYVTRFINVGCFAFLGR